MFIIISFIFEGIAQANENMRVISLDEAIKIGLKNNKAFLLETESMRLSAQNSYLNAKAEYCRPFIDSSLSLSDSSLSLSEEKKLTIQGKQKFLFPKTGAIISLENNYNLLKEGEEIDHTTVALNLSQPLSPKEILTNKRILRDIKDNYTLSLRALKSIEERMINQIINGYVNLIRQEMSIQRNRKRIETQNELLVIANLRYKAGEITKIDIMDIELQNKLDKINILTEEDNYRKSRKEFLRLLGLDRERDFTIKREIKPFFDSLPSIDKTIARAKDYQLLESNISLKRKEESLKESRLSKNLSVFLNADYSSQFPFTSSAKRTDEKQIALKMEYKFYDSGRYKRDVQQQQKEFEREQYNLQELNKKVEEDIQEIYKEIELMKQKKELLITMEKIADALLEAGKIKFKMGMISQSELNNIMERYNKTYEEIAEIEIENFLFGIRLLTLTGELSSYFIGD